MNPRTQNSGVAILRGVGFGYGKVRALDSVDLVLHPGEVTALLGPNGAGKSTLIHLLLGLLPVQTGRVELFGCSPPTSASLARVGSMLQSSGVQDNLTVRELIQLFASLYPNPSEIDQLLEEAGLEGLEHRWFSKLSGGQKQRLMFALSLVGNPDLLILDEPTVGLDPAARQRMWRVIENRQAQGTSVLLSTHYLAEAAQLANQVVVLHQGRVLTKGSPDSIRSRIPNSMIRARSSLSLTEIRGLDQILRADATDHGYQVMSNDPPETLRAWLAADQDLQDLEVCGADLETAVMALIGDNEITKTQDSLTEAA